MRKKLLALLMCATMVLGSSVVASAEITDGNVTDAETVFSNGSKITDENDASTSVLSTPVSITGGTAYYGFNIDDGTPIRLDDSKKKALKVGTVDIDKATKGNPSVTAGALEVFLQAACDDDSVVSKLSSYDGVTVGFVSKGDVITGAASTSNQSYKVYIATIDTNSTNTTVSLADTTIVEATTKDGSAPTVKSGKVTNNVKYYTTDGYLYIEETGLTGKLLKAYTGLTSADGTTNYAYTLEATKADDAGDELTFAVAGAIANGTLDKNAAAVKIEVIQYGTAANTPYVVRDAQALSSAVTLTLNNDLLSRLKLKNYTTAYYISDTYATDDVSGKYRVVAPISSDIDYSAAYGTFTLPVNFVTSNGYVIFGQGSDASQNDGVSTETTAAPADKTTSYTTGDVAPIAALAIVMMGAFGAMVVASKKRV